MEARIRGFFLLILTWRTAKLQKPCFLGTSAIGIQTEPIEPFTLFSDQSPGIEVNSLPEAV